MCRYHHSPTPCCHVRRRVVRELAAASRPALEAAVAANDDAALAEAVDAYVRQCLEAWPDQPALGVAVVREGQTVLARGYGVKAQDRPGAADEHTLFAIASNTKNVTAAALAILVDEGKVAWDAPIRTYLPGFTLSDPYIGEHITVRDTLSHRAGFGLDLGCADFLQQVRTRADPSGHRLMMGPL